MSSFRTPHHLYLFTLRSGKKKIAYGPSPETALETLSLRLSEAELSDVLADTAQRIQQHELRKCIGELG